MRLLFLLTLATAFGIAFPRAHAIDLASYPFSNNLQPVVQSGVTATALSGSGSKAAVGMGSAGPIDDPYENKKPYAYILVKVNSTNSGSSFSNKQFAEFTVTPPAQNGMNIDQIQVSAARGGKSNPRGLALRWSFDGYSSDLGTASIGSVWPSTTTYTFPLYAFTGGPVTFRLYAYAKQISNAEASIRMTNLAVQGNPVFYPPTVTPQARRIETTKTSVFLRGTAYDSAGIRRVEVARGSIRGVYSGADGTANWRYNATSLRRGKNYFYVRAIDTSGTVGPAVRINVVRKATPKPTPKPTP